MISPNMILALCLFALGQTMAWFQLNSQFVWQWWENKPFFATAIFSIPTGLCFWYGIRLCYQEMGEIWGPRFLIFCMSYLTFPLFTWYFLNESMFTTKTLVCVFLSFLIVAVQLFWR